MSPAPRPGLRLSEKAWGALLFGASASILAVTVYCLSQGITIIFMHLYYFPIILLAYHYKRKGVLLSAVLGIFYVALVIFFTFPDLADISGALVRFVVFVGIAAVVSFLSETLEKREFERSTIISNSEDGIFIVDLSSQVIAEVNLRGAEMLGYTPEELAGCTLETVWPDAPERVRFSEIIVAADLARNFEAHLARKTGETRTVLISAGTLPEQRGVLTVTDITDRELMLSEIARLSEVRQSIISNANVWLMVLDSRGRILEWNRAAEEISGYAAAEVMGEKDVWKLLYPEKDYRREITEKITGIIHRDNYLENLQTTIVSKSGKKRTILWNTRGLPDSRGIIGNYIAIGIDITDREKAEQVSREYAEWYSAILRTTQDGYNLVDATGRLIEVNENYCRMTGFSREELRGRSIYDLDAEESKDEALAHLQKILATGSDRFETRHRTKGGGVIDVEISVVLQAQKRELIVFIRNITERKLAERALLESEEKFHMMADFTADWEYWQGQEKQVIYMSPSCERITGYSPQEFIADPGLLEAIVHPDDLASVLEHNSAAWNTRDALSVEFRIIRRDGSECWIAHACQQVYDRAGNALGRRVNNRDITGQKNATQVLVESEEKFRAFFTTSRDCVFITTPEGRWIDLNDAAVELFGYDSREELLGVNVRDHYAFPEQRAKHLKVISEKGFTKEYPVDLRKHDGTIIHTLISSVVRKDRNGTIIGFQGTIRDITEQKRTEEALRESQLKLAESMDLAHLVNWEFDVLKGIFTFNDRFYALYGTTAEREGGYHMPAEVYAREFVHPDEMHVVADEVSRAIHTTDPNYVSQVEHRIIRRDGEIRHIVVRIRITKDADGRTIKTHGVNQEITERKLAEEALAQSEYRYRTLAESAQDIIFTINRDLQFTFVNTYGAVQAGKTPEECIGMPLQALFPPQTFEKMRDILLEVFERGRSQHVEMGRSQHVELEIPLPSSHQWHDTLIVPLVDTGGNIFSVLGISRDITELKNKEAALKKAHDELEKRVRERTSELARVNVELEAEITERSRINERITKLSTLKETLLATGNLGEKLKLITDGVIEIFDADFARIWMVGDADLCGKGCKNAEVTEGPHVCRDRSRCLHLMVSSGRYTHIDGGHRRVPMGAYKIGRVATGEYAGFVTNDVTRDPRVHDHEWARSLGLVSFAGYRLSSAEGRPIGVLALFSTHKIEPWEEKLLEDIANTTSQVFLKGMAEDSLKESEERFRSLVETTSDMVWEVDRNGKYTYVSPKVRDLLGYAPEEVIGKSPFDLMPPDEAEKIGGIFKGIVESEKNITGLENINLRKDGRQVVLETNGVPIHDEDGNLLGYRGIDRDITERKAAQERIIASLNEKEILLREVHHRVKNNFQIIISLLSLQSRSIGDEKVAWAFRESQNRIRAMAFVHEKLYTSKDLTRIDLEAYVKYLTAQLFTHFEVRPRTISLRMDIKNIFVDINAAIPLGLIINEMVLNSLKHAFPDGRKGEIAISIRDDGPGLLFTYQDNGIGFRAGFDWRTTDTIGFKIIRGLVEQLNGAISQEPGEGTRFSIRVMKRIDEEGRPRGTFNPVPE